jgi:hypothetical protein
MTKLSRNIELVSVTTARLIPRNQGFHLPHASFTLLFFLLFSLLLSIFIWMTMGEHRSKKMARLSILVKFFVTLISLLEHCSAIGLSDFGSRGWQNTKWR